MGDTLKKILVNKDPWQTRVAVLHNDRLQDIFFDTHVKTDLERCFFKGKISKVLPGIQTAFVDIGQPRAGFLHITEIDRELAAQRIAKQTGEQKDASRIKHRMDIGKVFKEGEDVLVQVIKEPVFEKGAKLTTCFTLPGRYVVLMPNISQIGISKKIDKREERSRLKEILRENLPEGMGAIIRTTADGVDTKKITGDISFLVSTWNTIRKKYKKAQPAEKIHEDLPISFRAVRDHLDESVEIVLTDSKENQKSLHSFVKSFSPEQASKIRMYKGAAPLFTEFEVDKQIDKALQKKVNLKSGGSLIIESTEAMTVIDVNTGKFVGADNLEDTILKTNLEAADEVVTQLRLRNIGGLIVIDFIDLSNSANRRKLSWFFEKTLKERDKFQSVALKVSEFGLVQMTRKRSGKTLVQQLTNVCQTCNSYGFVKSDATLSYAMLVNFKSLVRNKDIKKTVVLSVANKIFDYLVHNEYKSLLALEKEIGCSIILESNEQLDGANFTISQPSDVQ